MSAWENVPLLKRLALVSGVMWWANRWPFTHSYAEGINLLLAPAACFSRNNYFASVNISAEKLESYLKFRVRIFMWMCKYEYFQYHPQRQQQQQRLTDIHSGCGDTYTIKYSATDLRKWNLWNIQVSNWVTGSFQLEGAATYRIFTCLSIRTRGASCHPSRNKSWSSWVTAARISDGPICVGRLVTSVIYEYVLRITQPRLVLFNKSTFCFGRGWHR